MEYTGIGMSRNFELLQWRELIVKGECQLLFFPRKAGRPQLHPFMYQTLNIDDCCLICNDAVRVPGPSATQCPAFACSCLASFVFIMKSQMCLFRPEEIILKPGFPSLKYYIACQHLL